MAARLLGTGHAEPSGPPPLTNLRSAEPIEFGRAVSAGMSGTWSVLGGQLLRRRPAPKRSAPRHTATSSGVRDLQYCARSTHSRARLPHPPRRDSPDLLRLPGTTRRALSTYPARLAVFGHQIRRVGPVRRRDPASRAGEAGASRTREVGRRGSASRVRESSPAGEARRVQPGSPGRGGSRVGPGRSGRRVGPGGGGRVGPGRRGASRTGEVGRRGGRVGVGAGCAGAAGLGGAGRASLGLSSGGWRVGFWWRG